MIVEHVAAQKKLVSFSSEALSVMLLGVATVLIIIALTNRSVVLKSIAAAYVLLP